MDYATEDEMHFISLHKSWYMDKDKHLNSWIS